MIYTATFHHAHNYGAMLQAYALQTSFLKMGFDNQIIDYYVSKENLFVKGFGKNELKNNLFTLIRYKDYKRGFERFERFNNDYLIKTPHLTGLEQWQELGDDNAVYVVGSDQVWKCNQNSRLSPFFSLEFVPDTNKVVTYAVSMGGYHKIPKDDESRFNAMLHRFDRVSLREKSTVEFLHEQYKVKTVQHVDPVFLLTKEEWETLGEKGQDYNLPDKYVMCYELVPNEKMQKLLDIIRQQTKLPVVVVSRAAASKLKADYVIRDGGPLEFLKILNKASIVATDSFHGAAFGNLMNKRTIAVMPNVAERTVSLLSLLGLEEFGIKTLENVKDLLIKDIDFEFVNKAIDSEREKSLRYLKSQIES